MKFAWILLAIPFFFTSPANEPVPCCGANFVAADKKEPKQKHGKGLKLPTGKVLAKLHADSLARNGGRMAALPRITAAQYDCRTLGLVPPIRDQGQCGSCWDFSGSGVVTSALIKAGQIPNSANECSEQYTLDCGQNGGCNGDDNTTVLAWAKTTGLPLDNAYGPYTGSSGQCKATSSTKLYTIQDWGYCTPGQQQGIASTQDIKNAMVAYGPIGSAVAADDAFSNYTDGVFDSTTSTDIDHDIILIGWDDTKGKNGAWLLRNSWNTSWGIQGYMWIGYGVNAVGTEAVWASATSLPPPPPAPPAPPTPVPPGPTPTPSGLGVFTIPAALPAGTYELNLPGTMAANQQAISVLQAVAGKGVSPTYTVPSIVEDRISALEKGQQQTNQALDRVLKLLEGKK
jgi:C1A family cysteine protease